MSRPPHDLSIEEIEETAAGFKEDLQRDANRKVRRHDTAGALGSLEAIEYVDKFVYTLKLRAGSQLGQLVRPARARDIHIPDSVKQAAKKRKDKKSRGVR
jgi:hypothetical protein